MKNKHQLLQRLKELRRKAGYEPQVWYEQQEELAISEAFKEIEEGTRENEKVRILQEVDEYVLRGKTIELVHDKQGDAAANLRVLYYAITALRMNEVRGMSEVFESAYLQLAAPKQKRNPYDVLMILPDSPIEVAEAVFKNLAMKYHPDRGGNVETFKELNEAIEAIRKEKKQ